MTTRPAKATGKPAASRPRRAQGPGQPAPAKAPGKAPAKPPAPGAPAPATPAAAPGERPRALRLAAALQALEAVGLCVAAGFAAVATADGQSYQRASGIALTLIAVGLAAVFALFAVGLARAKPWTRTPVVMVQLFVIIAGITLLDGHRPEWGVPALLLAACCLFGLFTPASLRALNRS